MMNYDYYEQVREEEKKKFLCPIKLLFFGHLSLLFSYTEQVYLFGPLKSINMN